MSKTLTVDKALRTYHYMKRKDESFKKKHADILKQNHLNEVALNVIEHQTWVYMKCSHCGEIYLIHFEKYLKNPLIYKDWVCSRCEQVIINEKLRTPHKTFEHYRGYHRVDELVFNDKSRFYFGYFSDGTLNGIRRCIVDMLGRKMYEVE